MTFDFKWQQPELLHELSNEGREIGLPVDNWEARDAPPRTDMLGRYCRIEAFDVSRHGADLLQAFLQDTHHLNWTYLPYGPFSSLDEFEQWAAANCNGDDPQFHSIIDLSTGQAVGMASYLRIDPPVGVIEVGHIHLSPLMQATRLSTECMYLMMARVFDELGYRRYEWKCDALNQASVRAALRLGFQFEGIFRQATMYKGRNRDTAWLAILDKDWPRLKDGFEAWLSPDNFNEDGSQKQRLQDCMGS